METLTLPEKPPETVQEVFLKTAERIDRYGLLHGDWGGAKHVDGDLIPCAGCLIGMLRIECGLHPHHYGYEDGAIHEREKAFEPEKVERFEQALDIIGGRCGRTHARMDDRVISWSDRFGVEQTGDNGETLNDDDFALRIEAARFYGQWKPVIDLLRELGGYHPPE